MSTMPTSVSLGGRVVVAGDLHGNLGWATELVDRAAFHGLNLILQLGDFGALWPGDGGHFERKLDRRLAARGVHLVFIGGNHDVWPALKKLPRLRSGFGALTDRIWWAPNGHRFPAGNCTFGVLGGAYSIDQDARELRLDWWPDEEPTQDEVDLLGEEPLDVLLTHEAPLGVPLLSGFGLPAGHRADRTRELVTQAVNRTTPSLLMHGHWHQRRTHQFERGDGGTTRVESLGMDGDKTGDAVILDLATLEVVPLPRRKQD
ncbi:metallophosphoesterase family protein [Georgenia subflava]|uniref:Metallophosphoesterase n=1 Tax=Georgenia subflava TaxID=1622177 RepID=A0A6N7EI92_9MICO|nr:metallophosphoesterase [Georgenia subflava]MPV36708.1 metallophosphoesterase [Georgenia subflava]